MAESKDKTEERETHHDSTEKRYRALNDLSVRRRDDPACEDFVDFHLGHTYAAATFPDHVNVRELLAEGQIEEV